MRFKSAVQPIDNQRNNMDVCVYFEKEIKKLTVLGEHVWAHLNMLYVFVFIDISRPLDGCRLKLLLRICYLVEISVFDLAYVYFRNLET